MSNHVDVGRTDDRGEMPRLMGESRCENSPIFRASHRGVLVCVDCEFIDADDDSGVDLSIFQGEEETEE